MEVDQSRCDCSRTYPLLCSAGRLECLEDLSHKNAPPARAASVGDNWVVSDTTSLVDYTPIVSASTASRGGSDGSSMQVSIHCRSSPRNTPMPARRFLRDVPASIFR
jgi:hypothetical protein